MEGLRFCCVSGDLCISFVKKIMEKIFFFKPNKKGEKVKRVKKDMQLFCLEFFVFLPQRNFFFKKKKLIGT